MRGILLSMDAGRQQRVGTEPLKKLLSPAMYAKVLEKETKLNASMMPTTPFAPTLVRPSFYPEYFRATEIRTLFWKVKNLPGLHGLTRVYVDPDSRVVFQFDDMDDSTSKRLLQALYDFGHYEFSRPKVTGSNISYDVTMVEYPRSGEDDE